MRLFRKVGLFGLLVVAVGLGLAARYGLSVQRERQIRLMVPQLDSSLAAHLAYDDSSRWTAYAVEVGPRPLMDGYVAVLRAAAARSRPDFMRDRAQLNALLLRVADALATRYACVPQARLARLLASLAPDREFELLQISRRYAVTQSDSSLSTTARLARLIALQAAADSAGNPYTSMAIQFSMARLELELGNPERQRARIESALASARRFEDDYLVCQILGELAQTHLDHQHADSAVACVEEGLRLAGRHQFSDQIARFMRYRARRAIADGRYALAAKCMADAVDLTESLGGSGRLRSAIDYARFLADLGCWDLVEGVLRRVPPLQREFASAVERDGATKYAFDADDLRARVAFAKGDVTTAVALLDHWSRTMPSWNRRSGLEDLYRSWSWGLQRNARFADALAVATRGLEHCDSAHVEEHRLTMALRRSRLLEQLGSIEDATGALDDAVRHARAAGDSNVVENTLVRVMCARLRLREGARREGLDGLRQAFASIRGDLAAGAADAQGSEGLTVREAVHELAGLTPEQGYGFELEWRSRMRRASTARDGRAASPPGAFSPAPARDGTHLLYAFVDYRLLRWCAGPSGVTVDTLPLSPQACLAEVREAIELLQSESPDSRSWYGPRTRRALERLSQQLLPAAWPGPEGGSGTLEISPDGPLQALPFEALITPGSDGLPLTFTAAVSYDLGWRSASRVAPSASLIFASPSLPPTLRRRYASPPQLQDDDVRSARALWAGARLLEGDSATKAAFLEAADRASRVYVAGHHLLNPSVPFLGYLPVASATDAPVGDALLEASDLSGLDLSGCELAVLATCAGGAPKSGMLQPGPSLRDAFIDAGAHAVVSSFWDVDDEETSAFMRMFLTEFEHDHDAAHALERARRDAISASPRMSPRVWAGWSVAVTHERVARAKSSNFVAGPSR